MLDPMASDAIGISSEIIEIPKYNEIDEVSASTESTIPSHIGIWDENSSLTIRSSKIQILVNTRVQD